MTTKTPSATIFTPMTPPAKVAYFQRMLGMDLVVLEHQTMMYISAERLAESLGVDWELIKEMITAGEAPSLAGYGVVCFLHCGIDLAGQVSHPENSGLFLRLTAVKKLILDIDMTVMQKTHTEAACNRLADMKADIRSVQGSVWNTLDPHNAITNADAMGYAAARQIFH